MSDCAFFGISGYEFLHGKADDRIPRKNHGAVIAVCIIDGADKAVIGQTAGFGKKLRLVGAADARGFILDFLNTADIKSCFTDNTADFV